MSYSKINFLVNSSVNIFIYAKSDIDISWHMLTMPIGRYFLINKFIKTGGELPN